MFLATFLDIHKNYIVWCTLTFFPMDNFWTSCMVQVCFSSIFNQSSQMFQQDVPTCTCLKKLEDDSVWIIWRKFTRRCGWCCLIIWVESSYARSCLCQLNCFSLRKWLDACAKSRSHLRDRMSWRMMDSLTIDSARVMFMAASRVKVAHAVCWMCGTMSSSNGLISCMIPAFWRISTFCQTRKDRKIL